MSHSQAGILAPIPELSRYLLFQLTPGADVGAALQELAAIEMGDQMVIGLGSSTVSALGVTIDGLRDFPALVNAGISVPSTPCALWCWLRGVDRGRLLHQGRYVIAALEGAFFLESILDGFCYAGGRDLSGYEDGTENPTGNDATETALVAGRGPGLDNSSFVAVQHWEHDLSRLEQMTTAQQDHIIGRRISDNEEIEDAPASAHVKRTAQESFTPEAFLLRRSMPWADMTGEGLVFVAFASSFDAYDAQLRRMIGQDDGIVDGLFEFTRPISGAYFWCPPIADDYLDFSILGL